MPEPYPPPRTECPAERVAERVRTHIRSTFSSVVHPRQWTRPIVPAGRILRVELLAGLVVALALIPEALESLLTAKLVDDITETRSDKDREAGGQGIAHVVTGFFGGMAGCAMIGQTIINVRAGNARTRLSTFGAGLFVIVLVVGLGGLVAVIPMAALVAVMVLVAVSTFDWHSIAPATLRRLPTGETGSWS